MCGRFKFEYSWAEYYEGLSIIRKEDRGRNVPARYNVAPTQDVLFIAQKDNEIAVRNGRWWLVPHWAKELPKYPMFNARSEDAHKKPAFRDAYKTKRCLVPADAYYEWTKADDGKKDPHLIHLPDNQPFAFAGLWAYNSNLDITSCTILTAAADPAIAHLHHRMPIIMNKDEYETWLNPETPVDDARALLTHNRGAELQSYQIGRAIGNSRLEGPELIKPV